MMHSVIAAPRTAEHSRALENWLSAVSFDLAARKHQRQQSPSRERARRQAKRLFADYYRRLAESETRVV